MKACEKRPVSIEKMEDIATSIERTIQRKSDREVNSRDIGELVMEKLRLLDDVAYVRFASVYRQFKDVSQFMKELRVMLMENDQSTRQATWHYMPVIMRNKSPTGQNVRKRGGSPLARAINMIPTWQLSDKDR